MNPLLHLIVRPGPRALHRAMAAAPSRPSARSAPSAAPASAAPAVPAAPVAPVTPVAPVAPVAPTVGPAYAAAADPDDALPRCGWFDSSLDLRAGLLVQEHASADAVAGDLPLAAWLALHLAGGPARPGAASSGA